MKRVFSHPNAMMIGSMASMLNRDGIETLTRNDILGGASGEIAPGETWVELWVVDDSSAEAAEQLIKAVAEAPEGDDWDCQHCRETNPATFEVCWHCGEPA